MGENVSIKAYWLVHIAENTGNVNDDEPSESCDEGGDESGDEDDDDEDDDEECDEDCNDDCGKVELTENGCWDKFNSVEVVDKEDGCTDGIILRIP